MTQNTKVTYSSLWRDILWLLTSHDSGQVDVGDLRLVMMEVIICFVTEDHFGHGLAVDNTDLEEIL